MSSMWKEILDWLDYDNKGKTMNAIFIGQDDSCGFEYGKVYCISSFVTSDRKIWIEARNRSCSYSSLETVLENWKFL